MKPGWLLPALAGALLCAGCAAPRVPRAALYGGDAADPAAPEAPFVAPPNSLAGVRRCPAHPDVEISASGACPICAMALVRR